MYERIGNYDINDVLSFVELNRSKKEEVVLTLSEKRLGVVCYNGYPVKIYSDRYLTFFKKGVKCCMCGLEGKYFGLERTVVVRRKKKEKIIEKPKSFHFNLYTKDITGREIMLTKDHIIPKTKGGKSHISNYQTMCEHCNSVKGNMDIKRRGKK